MRKVKRGIKKPKSLTGKRSIGEREKKKAVDLYKLKKNANEKILFKAYKSEDVKTLLEALFHKKCAYCESKYGVTSPVDVEHFRPKGRIHLEDGSKKVPGYYWLAADWKNLLPACINCNREEFRKVIKQKSRIKTGKGDKFPLVDEKKRATKPGGEVLEKAMLINPTYEDPRNFFEYNEEGFILPKNGLKNESLKRAQVTIDLLGLQREDLVLARQERWGIVRMFLELLKLKKADLKRNPKNILKKKKLKEEEENFCEYIKESQEFFGMIEYLLSLNSRF